MSSFATTSKYPTNHLLHADFVVCDIRDILETASVTSISIEKKREQETERRGKSRLFSWSITSRKDFGAACRVKPMAGQNLKTGGLIQRRARHGPAKPKQLSKPLPTLLPGTLAATSPYIHLDCPSPSTASSNYQARPTAQYPSTLSFTLYTHTHHNHFIAAPSGIHTTRSTTNFALTILRVISPSRPRHPESSLRLTTVSFFNTAASTRSFASSATLKS